MTASPDLGYGENRRYVVVAGYPDAGAVTAWLLSVAADESLVPAGIDHDFTIPLDKTIIVTRAEAWYRPGRRPDDLSKRLIFDLLQSQGDQGG